jgi:hypothetical protein
MAKHHEMTSLCIASPQEKSICDVSELVARWLAVFSRIFDKKLETTDYEIYKKLLRDISPAVLDKAFEKAASVCKFFPKPGEIREHVEKAKEIATDQAAGMEWERVLDYRRLYWSPDAPGGFYRGMPKLSERTQHACRAAGVFREQESIEALHVWAKKRFVDSFIAWDKLEQSKFLLPDGEIKKLIAKASEQKTVNSILEPQRPPVSKLPEALASKPIPSRVAEQIRTVDAERRLQDLRRQAEIITEKFPQAAKGMNP